MAYILLMKQVEEAREYIYAHCVLLRMPRLQATEKNCNRRTNRTSREGTGKRACRSCYGTHGAEAAPRVSAADLALLFRIPLWAKAALTISSPCVVPFKIQIPGEGHLIGLPGVRDQK